MYLISPDKQQFKANLHSHSTYSDGKLTPIEIKELYKRHGYSILAITDHEVPKAHNELTEPDFLMITGYENYIRPDEYSIYMPEVHLNLFAKDPNNETMICYDPRFCKYLSEEEQQIIRKAGSERPREYSVDYVNEYIRTARENGYLVSYNHPTWSREKESDILAYEGCFSMEICNYSSFLLNHLEYNGQLYDKMLRAGKKVFCHSADDNHNRCPEDHPAWDSFGGFTMFLLDELTYDNVIDAMEKGEMYSSMGPVFREISIADGKIHIECSDVSAIYVHCGSRSPRRKYAEPGKTLTQADFVIDPKAKYIRVSVVDREGRFADTRGFFREEWEK